MRLPGGGKIRPVSEIHVSANQTHRALTVLPATTISRRPRAHIRVLLAALPWRGALEIVARLAIPATVAACGVALGTFSQAGGAETAYLTGLATAVLAAVTILAPRPAWEATAGAVLVVLALWVMPAGPTRGAVLGVLLTACLAVSAARGMGGHRRAPSPVLVVVLLLGLQVLLCGERLVTVGADDLVALLVLPLLGAASLVLLGRRHGVGRAFVAGAALLTVAPGWTAASTLAILALAAGEVLRKPRLEAAGFFPPPLWLVRAGAILALLAPLLWEPRVGWGWVVAGLALASVSPQARSARRWLPLLPALLALAAAAAWPARPWREALALAAWLPLLLPAWIAVERRRLPGLAAALILLVAVARGAPADFGPAFLAAPVALAALALSVRRPSSSTWRSAAMVLQGLWATVLLGMTVLAAAYPWLRPQPVKQALALLGLQPTWTTAVLLAGGLAVLATTFGALRLSARRTGTAGAFALLALLLAQPPPVPVAVAHPAGSVKLGPNHPRWRMELPGEPVSSIVVDTSLSYAAGLPPGTPVAVVRLEGRRGQWMEWPLRSGEQTGEWAAERPDVASRAGFQAPEPWLVEVVEGRFFAHRYRCRLEVTPPSSPEQAVPEEPVRLTVYRRGGLPPEVTLALFHLEALP